ncbi:MAG: hypothetical protein V1772_12085, partial [Chloroflexota bacterium]
MGAERAAAPRRLAAWAMIAMAGLLALWVARHAILANVAGVLLLPERPAQGRLRAAAGIAARLPPSATRCELE